MSGPEKRRAAAVLLIGIYPFALVLLSIVVNMAVFGVKPVEITLPPLESYAALTVAVVLLLANHSWLMTATELTRARFNLAASPEERAAKGIDGQIPSHAALDELGRHHNAHRNTTENAVYFVLLAPLLVLVSPPSLVVQVWVIGFGAARLGYTYSYLAGQTGLRGLFMSLSLLPLYGMASYLVLAFVV